MPFASQVQAGKDQGPRIWTRGLEWNLGKCSHRGSVTVSECPLIETTIPLPYALSSSDGRPSAIGNFLSTSNHLKEDTVMVTTEAEIIWTMEIREDR
jgi:hypothetical protein